MNKNKKTIDEILEESIILEEEQPYGVPENWVWMRFDSVINTISNRATAIKQTNYEEEGEIPVIDQGMRLISGFTNNSEHKYTGELPVIVFGDHTRCIKWIDFNFAQGADGTKLLKPLKHLYPKYFYYLLKTIDLPNKGYSRHFKYLRDSALPIPPLEEQKRIVEKVENFLNKIDESKQLIEKAKKSFKLRQSAILDKAFRGELTRLNRENDLSKPSIEKLLEEITKEKHLIYQKLLQASANKSIKKPIRPKKHNNSITPQKFMSDLPESWGVCTLGDVIYDFKYGTSVKSNYSSEGIPVLRIPNIGEKTINLDDIKVIAEDYVDQSTLLSKGDILIVRSNGSKELVGKCSIVEESEENYTFASYLIRLRPIIVVPEYILWLLKSNIVKEQLFSKSKSSSGINNINSQELASVVIPLPPIHEQNEIVYKINEMLNKEKKASELLDLIDQMEDLETSVLLKAFKSKLGTNISTEDSIIEVFRTTS